MATDLFDLPRPDPRRYPAVTAANLASFMECEENDVRVTWTPETLDLILSLVNILPRRVNEAWCEEDDLDAPDVVDAITAKPAPDYDGYVRSPEGWSIWTYLAQNVVAIRCTHGGGPALYFYESKES